MNTMLIAQLPRFEELRLSDLHLYELLDTPGETEFDELRELAAQICNCPISLITLIDKDRQWFKSKQGIAESETSRDVSFCSHAILNNEIMIIDDAASDERFFDNPLVTGDMNVRFYAGAPIISPTGQNLGTICVIDTRPRQLTTAQERAMEILSNQITKLLELRLKSKVLEQRAGELIRIKDEATIDLIKGQDEEKLLLAKELHENIAQELAASRLYLNMAVVNEGGRLDFINEANQSIGNALAEIKNLSYNIIPSTVDSVSVQVMMENFLHTHRSAHSFNTEIKITGKSELIGFGQAINCTKIAESWLQFIESKRDAGNVSIQISVEDDITLCIEDDASDHQIKAREQKLISSIVYYRVIDMNGSVKFIETERGTNLLCVNFPLVKK
ncbi:GAF domain-containing protein [Lacibacter sediminis]|uniref:GAF domain-containing protein n=1 Tax=Lacibacter sediminis TaxID=2760713 RepID=A0A7G5XLI5_9BACT|nr:GAF domain-containing protein [Lacibacter sediminis]QNA46338.1 GAF domain-containing protein [Lacibacter sediminis]